MRFPEFTEEWKSKTIDEIFELRNGYTPSKANNTFWDGGTIPWFRMEDIRQNGGVLYDAIQHITPEAVKGSGLFEPYSIILATTATIGEHAMLIADSLANQRFTNLKVHKSLTHKYDPYYLYYYFFGIDRWCLKNTNAGGLLSVDIPSLKRKQIYAPLLNEQKKIAKLFIILDDRIATQIKIIEDLKTLKSAISSKVFTLMSDYKTVKLGNLCTITTGKLDANAMTEDGQYMFFTCSKENNKTDTFAFEGKALLIAGNGEIGNVKYYDGKFNAYQRTYVLQNFSENIKYLQFYIEHFLPQRILKEKNVGAMPYIVLSTLADMPVHLPNNTLKRNIAHLLQTIDDKISLEINVLELFYQQKQFLLQQMFI